MAIPPESLQPAHDKLRDIWHASSTEETRVQDLIHNTPDPVFQGGDPDPVREEMIRTFEIVRAHRRYTRACIDALAWGERVEFLALPEHKAKAARAIEAAESFEKAAEDLVSVLIGLRDEAVNGNDLSMSSAYISERLSLAVQNYRYARDSARADLRNAR